MLLYFFTFTCNDAAGCPVPSLLNPHSLNWEKLRLEIGWPKGGIWDLGSWKVTGVVLAYYCLSMILWRVLPAQEIYGTKLLQHGRPLKYRLNGKHTHHNHILSLAGADISLQAFSSTIVHFVICAVGTYLQGADFFVWTYMTDNYVQILTANVLIAYALAIFLYIRSFSVDTNYPNSDLRELAAGGNTANIIYDFYIGRELNPRVTLPFLGEVDIKTWCEARPGLTGWILFDLAFIAKQYRTYGYLSDSIIFTTFVQAFYVLDAQYLESGMLTMIDITSDGMGFMLSFGDLVWVPFLYSTQCRYLSVYPVHLGWAGGAVVSVVFALGLYIFRAANTQKNVFRTRPASGVG